MSYDFIQKKNVVSHITDLQILERDDSYTIDDTTHVTAEHPFYVDREGTPIIVLVQDLRIGDRLYTESGAIRTIKSIEHIQEKIRVYNLLDVTPNNNYYANGTLVHNKGGGGHSSGGSHSSGGGGFGSSSFSSNNGYSNTFYRSGVSTIPFNAISAYAFCVEGRPEYNPSYCTDYQKLCVGPNKIMPTP